MKALTIICLQVIQPQQICLIVSLPLKYHSLSFFFVVQKDILNRKTEKKNSIQF